MGLGLFDLTYKDALNKSFLMKKIIIVRRLMKTMFYFLTSRLTIHLPTWFHQVLQSHYLKLNLPPKTCSSSSKAKNLPGLKGQSSTLGLSLKRKLDSLNSW